MAKDPVCGMVVDEKTAISAEIEGRQFYFCSSNCLNTFANPEKELSNLKKRMYVAASGALILAILRDLVYFSFNKYLKFLYYLTIILVVFILLKLTINSIVLINNYEYYNFRTSMLNPLPKL